MKRFLLAAVAFAASTSCGLAAVPSKQEVLDAITVMEKNISGPEAPGAAKTIVVFAQLSDDVMVDIGEEELPWLSEKWNLGKDQEQTCQSLLMAAFVAGDVKSQLKREKAEDDTYSGWLFTIETYHRLKARYDFTSPAIEGLSRMQSDGKLLDHAKEVESSELQQDQADNPPKPLA